MFPENELVNVRYTLCWSPDTFKENLKALTVPGLFTYSRKSLPGMGQKRALPLSPNTRVVKGKKPPEKTL